MLSRFSGFAIAAAFYAILAMLPLPFLERYFLGHPIAVATTILFCVAVGQLGIRYLRVRQSRKQLDLISDSDLVPNALHGLAGLDRSLEARPQQSTGQDKAIIPYGLVSPLDTQSPVVHRIDCWLAHLEQLPVSVSNSSMVLRLRSLLERQKRKGHATQLSDDMRDLSDRDADADHDVLQFVRIIVWAIPMLGFLGTVVGITQTLGGLDFSNGAAAVDQLKSGLYVAFDTTALGLVLSVIAIFLQFPVEKSSQSLLDSIDARTGRLVPSALAEHRHIDDGNPLAALQQMAQEISRVVQSSVQGQAELWRYTIDAAHNHWQSAAEDATRRLSDVLQQALGENLATSLKNHADALRRVQREGTDQIDNRWQQWQTALSDNARVLLAHQRTLLEQGRLLADSHARAKELERLQSTLDTNINTLENSLQTFDRGLVAVTGTSSLAEAMMTLAKAVDVLSKRIPLDPPPVSSDVDKAVQTTASRVRRTAA